VRQIRLPLALLVLVLALVASACGSSSETAATEPAPAGSGSETTASNPCAKDQLQLVNAGKLTIGTDNPAYPPWFDGGAPSGSEWKLNDPSTGKGFESAVAYAVADELGFSKDEVDWKVVPFDQSFRPGPKDFDFDINQISYSSERAQAVDFSDSYYDVNQALVALKANPIADAKSIADLHDAKLGAPLGTTSYQYIVDNIKPGPKPSVYNTLNDAIAAVKAKQIDGVMVDLPTAFYVTAAQLENSTIVGQFPAAGEQEHFGMVFEKGSPLVDCVNEALARLKDSGRLAEIQQEWLSDKASAPVLH
jgi:polar amino acid transport system substrate-binding protein